MRSNEIVNIFSILVVNADHKPPPVLKIRPWHFYFSSHLSKSVSIIIYKEIAGGVNMSTMENSFLQPTILRRAVREEIPFPVMSKRQKATKSLRIMCTQPKHTLTHIMSALFAFWGNVCHGTRRSVCTCIITINNNKGRRSSLFCTVYTQTPASR